MPCPDFVTARAEKSVPPKKSHSWRSHHLTSPDAPTRHRALYCPDSTPASGENMGPSTLPSDPQNGDGFRKLPSPRNLLEDMPIDFSLKSEPKSRLPEDRDGPQSKTNFYGHSFRIPNGRRMSHGSRFGPNVQEPLKTSPPPDDYFDLNHSADFGPRFSPGQRTKSPSPHEQSPSSSSKSPILAGMLAGNPPDILSGMPMDMLSSRLLPFGVPNGLGPVCVSGGNPNSVMSSPALFPPSTLLGAFMPSQVNLLPPLSPISVQNKMDGKGSRKVKQDRPFKHYDVSLQDDLQCNSLAWPVVPPLPPRAGDENSRAGSAALPHPNGHSENSLPSDPPSVAHELDNAPHSSVPNNAFEEPAETEKGGGGRKRKPVADSEKDASYWERRKKNNQAAKRSRENRRIKEDTVAQQALYFRSEVARLSQLVIHLNARIHDVSMKCASLEQDKLTLTAENAMYKQSLSQKRCGKCGNPLCSKPL